TLGAMRYGSHLSTHKPSERLSGYWFDPRLHGSWAVDLVHWLLDRGEHGVRRSAPPLYSLGANGIPDALCDLR
ncbi:hypothetical protein RZS08_17580, partial [Arthrospira platensis SPKY1]|nr:hypothetical protein [Arthrospira platensis SPKY1]